MLLALGGLSPPAKVLVFNCKLFELKHGNEDLLMHMFNNQK